MGLLDLFRPRRGVVAEPGEPIEFSRKMKARVWDLFLEARARDELCVNGGELVVRLDELPVEFERYRIARPSDRAIIVTVIPTPDDTFLGRPEWAGCECDATPLTSFDFYGLTLAGPAQVSYSAALGQGDFTDLAVPEFFVAGCYTFNRQQVLELPADASENIELVISNRRTGERTQARVRNLQNEFEYAVIGINRSPASRPEVADRHVQLDEHFVSTGGYFNVSLGLYAPDPGDEPYVLDVHALCGNLRSNTVSIEIIP